MREFHRLSRIGLALLSMALVTPALAQQEAIPEGGALAQTPPADVHRRQLIPANRPTEVPLAPGAAYPTGRAAAPAPSAAGVPGEH